ncbi:MAG: alpha/beta fold hydrolase [Pirellulales bacterium]
MQRFACNVLGLFVLATACLTPGWVLADDDDEKKKLPDPVDIELLTRDRLNLAATFYPSDEGKEAVPIIILHDWKSDRSKYRDMALLLQEKGHAVLVPDLRGHGGSTSFAGDDRRSPLQATRLRSDDFENMVRFDIESCKSYLMERNNARELNIEKLCLVGVELGSVLAVHYAHLDWSWRQLPNLKQGQDVKALVLISPPLNFRGMKLPDKFNEDRRASPLENYASRVLSSDVISVMILCGKADSQSMNNADKLFAILSAGRPKVAEKDRREKQSLFLFPLETELQAGKLVSEQQFQVPLFVHGFINARLVKKSHPWTDRTPP